MSRVPGHRRFFAELRRRKVFRSVALYGAAAFGVLQGVDVLVDALRLPPEITTVVALVALAGLPLIGVLSWRYQLTSEGLRPTEAASPTDLARLAVESRVRRWPSGLAALAGLALFGVGAWWTLVRDAGPLDASVAVLPFADLSEASDQEYFADGMAEEILHALVRVPGLRVTSRTSAFAFKNVAKDVREIGTELDVGAVLEGSVRRDANTVQVRAQLVDVATGFSIWSETFTRELRDVFQIQNEIARAIADVLRGSLLADADGAGEDAPMIRPTTSDPAAYDEYLRGRFEFNRRTPESLLAAIDHFDRATRLDSAFAPAYAGLGLTYALLPFYDDAVPPDVAQQKARESADRALRLDPDLPEAHAAAGQALPFGPERAEAFRRAIELDPFYAEAHQWRGETLSIMGFHDEAVGASRRGVELDSMSRAANLDFGRTLQRAGRYEEAANQFRKMIRRDPTWSSAWGNLAAVHVDAGAFDSARAAVEQSARIRPTWTGLEDRALRRVRALERRDSLGVPHDLPDEWARECASDEPFGYMQGVTECLELRVVAGQVDAVVELLGDFPVGANLGFPTDPVWDLVMDDPRVRARRNVELAILGHDTTSAVPAP